MSGDSWMRDIEQTIQRAEQVMRTRHDAPTRP